MIRSVSVFGLGKLGACLAACLASRGFDVVGVDVVAAAVKALNGGRAPVLEPGLNDLVAANQDRLSATLNDFEAVQRTDISFVLVPTPSTSEGGFSLEYASQAMRHIGRALAKKDDYHVVALVSTVLPASSAGVLIPLLERESGKRCGVDFGFCYNPEFVALGSVIRDLMHPDFVLIGESDSKAGDAIEELYRVLLPDAAPVCRMSLVNAELTKLSVNTYITAKITFANTLAEICERLPGADVDVVTGAIGRDSRIGQKYLRGAAPYGGPCFPRDNLALAHMARLLGTEAGLAEAVDAENRRFGDALADRVASLLPNGGRVAVMGLAYKPNTAVTDASPGLRLMITLALGGYDVRGYDAMPITAQGLGVAVAGSVDEALEGVDAVVIMTPDACYKTLEFVDSLAEVRPSFVLDCWRLLPDDLNVEGVRVIRSGVGEADAPHSDALLEALERSSSSPIARSSSNGR